MWSLFQNLHKSLKPIINSEIVRKKLKINHKSTQNQIKNPSIHLPKTHNNPCSQATITLPGEALNPYLTEIKENRPKITKKVKKLIISNHFHSRERNMNKILKRL